MDNYSIDNPIIALATPYGKAALAVIKISGTGSIELFKPFFSNARKLTTANKSCYGLLMSREQEVIDQVMVTPFFAPTSYTGEESLEIATHGNMRLVEKIIALLIEDHTIRLALPGEFTYRAFLHGKIDLTQAEAVHELVDAKTDKAANLALQRLEGSLSAQINKLYQTTLAILAPLNAHLDYPDEETEALPVFDITAEIKLLEALLNSFQQSKLLQDGVLVVIAGVPNVGKSSLFNLLLNQDRAIVSPIPGATRDYIESMIALEGIPIRLIDTAGLRTTDSVLEQLGVDKSRSLLKQADLILYLVDAATPMLTEEIELYREKTIFIANKCDLAAVDEQNFLAISVEKNLGLETLKKTILKKIKLEETLLQQQILLGSLRQQELCQQALTAFKTFAQFLTSAGDVSELAYFMRQASHALAAILGKNADKEAMDAMFSTFCLGK